MKTNNTPQKPGTAPCPYLSIPLEVAQDPALSDGAILLLGEIYGIQRAYGRCFASDAHFQVRRGKGRSTIQRQITELCAKGHLLIFADGSKRRELRVAERYLGGKDREVLPENGTEGHRRPVDSCLENEAEFSGPRLINENVETASCPQNGIYKTPESKIKNQENKTTPSLSSGVASSGVASSLKVSPEQEKAIKAAVLLLDDGRNEPAYASLYGQASERGRLDAWEVALASTQKARLRSGHMKSAPIAYFRTVLMDSWKLDPDFLRDQVKKQKQSEMKSLKLCSSGGMSEPQAWTSASAHVIVLDAADTTECGGGDEADMDAGTPVGDVRSLSPFSVTATFRAATSEGAASAFDALIARIPIDTRDEIVSRAKAMVQQNHPALWSRGENKPGCLRLVIEACKGLMNQE